MINKLEFVSYYIGVNEYKSINPQFDQIVNEWLTEFIFNYRNYYYLCREYCYELRFLIIRSIIMTPLTQRRIFGFNRHGLITNDLARCIMDSFIPSDQWKFITPMNKSIVSEASIVDGIKAFIKTYAT